MQASWDMTHPAQAATALRAWHQMFAMPMGMATQFTRGMCSNMFLRAAMPAAVENMERAVKFAEISARPWHKPRFNVPGASITTTPISPFFDLVHFQMPHASPRPKILLFAPMSGHDATILNDTIRGLSKTHDVYVSAPVCASQVPVSAGPLTLDAYIDMMKDTIRSFKGNVHVMAVSQPGPLLLAAISLMEAARDPFVPKSASFIGCPIDPRINPTQVDRLTTQHGTKWFERNALAPVAAGNPGVGRMVYPGMMQMTAFACVPANAKEDVYHDTAITDLDATYFTQTIDRVFVKAELPAGIMTHTDAKGVIRPVNPAAITRVAMMAVEGAQDEIAAPGQTRAALDLAVNLPPSMKTHHLQPGAGHYGIIHGDKWQNGVLPRLSAFIGTHDAKKAKPNQKLEAALP